MNGNQMMGRRTGVPEKSKRGIKGVLKELFTYSSKLRLPMIIAFVFSMIGAVLTIIGPNQLSRITDHGYRYAGSVQENAAGSFR